MPEKKKTSSRKQTGPKCDKCGRVIGRRPYFMDHDADGNQTGQRHAICRHLDEIASRPSIYPATWNKSVDRITDLIDRTSTKRSDSLAFIATEESAAALISAALERKHSAEIAAELDTEREAHKLTCDAYKEKTAGLLDTIDGLKKQQQTDAELLAAMTLKRNCYKIESESKQTIIDDVLAEGIKAAAVPGYSDPGADRLPAERAGVMFDAIRELKTALEGSQREIRELADADRELKRTRQQIEKLLAEAGAKATDENGDRLPVDLLALILVEAFRGARRHWREVNNQLKADLKKAADACNHNARQGQEISDELQKAGRIIDILTAELKAEKMKNGGGKTTLN